MFVSTYSVDAYDTDSILAQAQQQGLETVRTAETLTVFFDCEDMRDSFDNNVADPWEA